MTHALLELDAMIHREADQIMDVKGVRSVLRRHGKVQLAGSYRLSLIVDMYGPVGQSYSDLSIKRRLNIWIKINGKFEESGGS